MAAESLDKNGVCKHFRGTCFTFNASPYEYSRTDLDNICQDIHGKGINNDDMVWEMYSSSSGLSCFTVLLPFREKKRRLFHDREPAESSRTKAVNRQIMDIPSNKPSGGHFYNSKPNAQTSEIPYNYHSSRRTSSIMSSVSLPTLPPLSMTSSEFSSSSMNQFDDLKRSFDHFSFDAEVDQTESFNTGYNNISDSMVHSIFSSTVKPKEKKWKIITLGLKLNKKEIKVCPCYKVYSVTPEVWLPAGMVLGKHKGRTSRINVREVVSEYLRELEKFGKYKKIGRNCSDFAATFINLMSASNNKSQSKVSGVEVMCEACHRWICKCCC